MINWFYLVPMSAQDDEQRQALTSSFEDVQHQEDMLAAHQEFDRQLAAAAQEVIDELARRGWRDLLSTSDE